MDKLLEQAIEQLKSRSQSEQNQLARLIMDELYSRDQVKSILARDNVQTLSI